MSTSSARTKSSASSSCRPEQPKSRSSSWRERVVFAADAAAALLCFLTLEDDAKESRFRRLRLPAGARLGSDGTGGRGRPLRPARDDENVDEVGDVGDDDAGVGDSEKCAAELMKLETDDAREGRGRAMVLKTGMR